MRIDNQEVELLINNDYFYITCDIKWVNEPESGAYYSGGRVVSYEIPDYLPEISNIVNNNSNLTITPEIEKMIYDAVLKKGMPEPSY